MYYQIESTEDGATCFKNEWTYMRLKIILKLDFNNVALYYESFS